MLLWLTEKLHEEAYRKCSFGNRMVTWQMTSH